MTSPVLRMLERLPGFWVLLPVAEYRLLGRLRGSDMDGVVWMNRGPAVGSCGRGDVGEETPDVGEEGATPGRGALAVGEGAGAMWLRREPPRVRPCSKAKYLRDCTRRVPGPRVGRIPRLPLVSETNHTQPLVNMPSPAAENVDLSCRTLPYCVSMALRSSLEISSSCVELCSDGGF